MEMERERVRLREEKRDGSRDTRQAGGGQKVDAAGPGRSQAGGHPSLSPSPAALREIASRAARARGFPFFKTHHASTGDRRQVASMSEYTPPSAARTAYRTRSAL